MSLTLGFKLKLRLKIHKLELIFSSVFVLTCVMMFCVHSILISCPSHQ